MTLADLPKAMEIAQPVCYRTQRAYVAVASIQEESYIEVQCFRGRKHVANVIVTETDLRVVRVRGAAEDPTMGNVIFYGADRANYEWDGDRSNLTDLRKRRPCPGGSRH